MGRLQPADNKANRCACDADHFEHMGSPRTISQAREASAVGMLAFITRTTVRILDWLGERLLSPDTRPEHQRIGRRGEEDAYFYLRKQGYVMVSRNFRSPRHPGEIDLIAWDRDVLCFIEVKTRTSHDVKPAEAAVDREKIRDVALVARDYLRELGGTPEWRLDVVSVYYDTHLFQPQFELFKNSGLVA